MRHQVVLTNSVGDAVDLELRHRRHGQVENWIKNLKDCGLERLPFTSFSANAAWMEMVLCAADLLAWAQTLLFTGELRVAEPRTFRYRILHIAARPAPGEPGYGSPNTGRGPAICSAPTGVSPSSPEPPRNPSITTPRSPRSSRGPIRAALTTPR
jgi:hypothetical protein